MTINASRRADNLLEQLHWNREALSNGRLDADEFRNNRRSIWQQIRLSIDHERQKCVSRNAKTTKQ